MSDQSRETGAKVHEAGGRCSGTGRRAAAPDDAGREGRSADPVLLLPPTRGAADEPALGVDADAQPRAVEDALARGEVGSLLFVTDPAEINRLQRLAVEGNRRHPGAVRLRRHPRPAHRSSRCRSRWPRRGTRRRSNGARRSRPARPAPSASTGPSRRWSTSPGTRAGAGSSRARARTRSSARPSRRPRSAASRAPSYGAAGPDHRRPQALRRLRRRAGRPGLRRGQPVRPRALERLSSRRSRPRSTPARATS